jgi:CO dehydrogenase maturation factor
MSYRIAITGKGGVGKTTVSALLVTRLIFRGCHPVLAVDADPNTCLDNALGVQAIKSVGGVREDARRIAGKGLSAGISKQELLELKIAESLVEAEDFDLIAMGRPEGPGCYCYANNVLKQCLEKISDEYPWVVLDNEAGLENLSRRLVKKVDLLIMVADPSKSGLKTLLRLHSLARQMEIEFDKSAIIVNRLRRDRIPEKALEIRDITGTDFIIGIPEDDSIAELCEDGKSLLSLCGKNPAVKKIDEFIDRFCNRPTNVQAQD